MGTIIIIIQYTHTTIQYNNGMEWNGMEWNGMEWNTDVGWNKGDGDDLNLKARPPLETLQGPQTAPAGRPIAQTRR